MHDKPPKNPAAPQAKNLLAHMTAEKAETHGLMTSVMGDIQNIVERRQIPNPEMKETDESWMLKVYSLEEF